MGTRGLLLLLLFVVVLWVRESEGYSECGNAGEDYAYVYLPYLKNTTSSEYQTMRLSDAFFTPFAIRKSEPVTQVGNSVCLPIYSPFQPEFSQYFNVEYKMDCVVQDPSSLQSFFQSGVSLAFSRDGICPCSAPAPPSGSFVVGVTLQISGRYSGFIDWTYDIQGCEVTLQTSKTALQKGDKFSQTLIANSGKYIKPGLSVTDLLFKWMVSEAVLSFVFIGGCVTIAIYLYKRK